MDLWGKIHNMHLILGKHRPNKLHTKLNMTSEESQISEELKGCYENLIVIDIGANLTNKKYGRDLDSVVQRAKDAGIYIRERESFHFYTGST